jgi:SSS family solute:Na+ symporter
MSLIIILLADKNPEVNFSDETDIPKMSKKGKLLFGLL